ELVPVQVMAYASFVVLFPLVLWMGVRDWALSTITSLLVVAAAATAVVTRHPRRVGRSGLYPSLLLSTPVIGFTPTRFGPLVFVPALAALNTLFYVIQLGRRHAVVTIAIGCLPLVVPAILEATGVSPVRYDFSGGAMRVLPWMHALREPATPLFLFASSIG